MNIFRHRYLLTVLITVLAVIMPQLFFKNGFLLYYLSKLGLESSGILMMLSVPSAVMFFLSVPLAYYADICGKKKIGTIGIILSFSGFLLLTLSAFLDKSAVFASGIGITIYSVGLAGLLAGWFALLSPIVKPEERGSFFGTLRFSWQIIAIACSFLITYILDKYSSMESYQWILLFFTICLGLQVFFYLKIPEVEKPLNKKESFKTIALYLTNIDGYLPFCAYCFLLLLATGSWPVTLGLLEKDILKFSDEIIVHMGTMLFAGSVAGFYLGGKMVDRYGTRMVFLIVHFSYFIFLFLVLLRDFFPVSAFIYFSFITAALGLIQAASGIALTSEMMAIASDKYKSVAISFCTSLQVGGAAISGVLSGKIIDLDILNKSWRISNLSLSHYDTLILFYTVMVFVFVITLGLIPSVVKTDKAQWVPGSQRTL